MPATSPPPPPPTAPGAASPVTPAPGELEFVRRFVNTLDIEASTDRLHDPASWGAWASEQGVEASATPEELRFGRELREALRDALLANHDRAPLPEPAVRALDEAARRGALAVGFGPQGARLVPAAEGVAAVWGRVAAAVADALADGTWSRLKACASDSCRWAFYDTSRSRTGQWCSMRICGNRVKQARWRGGQAGSA